MDGISQADLAHRFAMIEGSDKLLAAIEAAQEGRNPRSSPDLKWHTNSSYFESRQVRYIGQRADPIPQQRNPCARCGVREDKHPNHGCGIYTRGGFG